MPKNANYIYYEYVWSWIKNLHKPNVGNPCHVLGVENCDKSAEK